MTDISWNFERQAADNYKAGRADERADAVAWLERVQYSYSGDCFCFSTALEEIESGAHIDNVSEEETQKPPKGNSNESTGSIY